MWREMIANTAKHCNDDDEGGKKVSKSDLKIKSNNKTKRQ